MQKRPNVKFLACLLGIIAVTFFGVHSLHGYQIRRNAKPLYDDALRLEEDKKFQQAASTLARYLALTRGADDAVARDAVARYGMLLARKELANTLRGRRRAYDALERALRRNPDRLDVRQSLARISMDLGRYADAGAHLETLLDKQPKDGELQCLAGQCFEAKGKFPLARNKFEDAVDHAPERIEGYLCLASLLRRHPNEVRGGEKTNGDVRSGEKTNKAVFEEADRTIEKMVGANPSSHLALLARIRYRTETQGNANATKENREDAEKALELAPDDPDVIVAAAELARTRSDVATARKYLENGCQRNPKEWHFYHELSRLDAQEGKSGAAVTCLRDGLRKVPGQVDLLWALASQLIQMSKNQEAAETIDLLKREGFPQAELDFLKARIRFNEEKWRDAAELLTTCYTSFAARSSQDSGPFIADLAEQTNLLLGRCYERLEDPDRAYQAYSRTAARASRSIVGQVRIAQLHAATGRLDKALDQYRQVMRSPDAPVAGWIEIARLLLERNSRRNAVGDQPDWAEVIDALTKARDQYTETKTPVPIEVALMLADCWVQQKEYDRARALLLKGHEDAQRRPIEIWISLAKLEQQQGHADKCQSLLDEAEKHQGDSVKLRVARIDSCLRRENAAATRALAPLAEGLERFKPGERRAVLTELADAYLQKGALKEAEQLWRALADEQPRDLHSRMALFDLALQAGDDDAMVRRVQDIQTIEGADGALWRYGRVCYLLHRAKHGDKEAIEAARPILNVLALRRPLWSRVPLCQAQFEDLTGNAAPALRYYSRAIQMGETRPLTLRRAMVLAFQQQDIGEAAQFLKTLLGRNRPEELTLTSEEQRVAADVSLRTPNNKEESADEKKERVQRAERFAALAVPATSKDFRDYLWLSEFRLRAGNKEAAGQALYRARELDDRAPETWLALICYLIAVEKKEEATAALDAAEQTLKPSESALVLAQCNQVAGRTKRAEELYQVAHDQNKEDPTTLFAFAEFLIAEVKRQSSADRNGSNPEAKAANARRLQDANDYLLTVEKLQGNTEAGRRALRARVMLKSSNGDYQDKVAALAVLNGSDHGFHADDTHATSPEDKRTKAHLLALQATRSANRDAVRILEELIDERKSKPEDHFLAAQLWERLGDWQRARKRWQSLDPLRGNDAQHIYTYAQNMLRHDQQSEAEEARKALERLEPKGFRARDINARLLKAAGKGAEAVALLRDYAQTKDANLAAARVLEDIGEVDAAEAHYRRFVAQSGQPQSVLVHVDFLRRQHRYRAALELCETAWQTCFPEAVCQEALLVLAEAPLADAPLAKTESHIQAAVQKDPKNDNLQLGLATLRNLQGRYEETEAIYSRLLETGGSNATVLNNLAWLRVLRENRAEEALELVKHALTVVGPQPQLTDTRAVILIALGQSGPAIKDLEEVVAEMPSASTYFHLAQAYQLAKQSREAAAAWKKAVARGLTVDTLHPLERPAFETLQSQLALK
jgi:tetratricopeptide (TPR) repeat protein